MLDSSTARAGENARTCWASAEEEEGHNDAGPKHRRLLPSPKEMTEEFGKKIGMIGMIVTRHSISWPGSRRSTPRASSTMTSTSRLRRARCQNLLLQQATEKAAGAAEKGKAKMPAIVPQQAPAYGVGGGGGGVGGKRKLPPWEEEEGEEELHDLEQKPAWAILPEHIPQAFSQFSYTYSDGTMLACDLQASTTIATGF